VHAGYFVVNGGETCTTSLPEGVTIAGQVWVQAKSVLFTAAWSGMGTWLILNLIDATVGIRVSREQEVEGLDLALHDERAYNS
jgi:Amt family ammonium transporter